MCEEEETGDIDLACGTNNPESSDKLERGMSGYAHLR